MTRSRPVARVAAVSTCILISAMFLYPYAWMLSGAFRTTREILSEPLNLWPAHPTWQAFESILDIGGISLLRGALNSLFITSASTLLAIVITAFGAYALTRRPNAPLLRLLRSGFLLSMMYPYMLLVIPVYIVMYRLGLLGGYAGIVLFLSLGPVQFFLFEQFFRTLPGEVIEAATVDGASEAQILFRVVLPMATPVVATVATITFLLNWAQWFPVLIISSTPDTYTLPVALLTLNGELGTNFQGIMAMALLTTLPPALVFLLAQRRVMSGLTEGAVKG